MAVDNCAKFRNYVLNSDLKDHIVDSHYSKPGSFETIIFDLHSDIDVTLQDIGGCLQFSVYIMGRRPYPPGFLFGEINKGILRKSVDYDEMNDFLSVLVEELQRLDAYFTIH